MDEMKQYVKKIEDQYKENFQKVSDGIWTLQQWYEYCAVVLCDLMNIHDKQTTPITANEHKDRVLT